MAKAPDAPYQAGRRGAGWLKVKPVHTLDLVVLAVEWGSGRRRGKLSNIHLGARDPVTGEFIMVGKTFKGMTDAMLDWQTARFRELAVGGTDGYVVQLRPEQVVEVALDGVQRSSRYPGGLALRFARVRALPRRQGPRRGRHHRCRARAVLTRSARVNLATTRPTGVGRFTLAARKGDAPWQLKSTTKTSAISAPTKTYRPSRSSTAPPSPSGTRSSSPSSP